MSSPKSAWRLWRRMSWVVSCPYLNLEKVFLWKVITCNRRSLIQGPHKWAVWSRWDRIHPQVGAGGLPQDDRHGRLGGGRGGDGDHGVRQGFSCPSSRLSPRTNQIGKLASLPKNFKSPTSKICLARSSSSLSKARVSASFSTLKVSKSVAFTLGSKEICYRGWQLQMLANY